MGGPYSSRSIGLEAAVFNAIITRVVGSALKELGYEIDVSLKPDEGVRFHKLLQEDIRVQIEFEPTQFVPGKFFQFTVNLVRDNPLQQFPYRTKYFLMERLASCLWIPDRADPAWSSDGWWPCLTEAALEQGCLEIRQQLVKYGFPYLEDLNSKSLNYKKSVLKAVRKYSMKIE